MRKITEAKYKCMLQNKVHILKGVDIERMKREVNKYDR